MNPRIHRIHRWLGLGLGALVLVWFLSGMVMRYVGHPTLSETERLAGAELVPGGWRIGPLEAVRSAGFGEEPGRVRLGARLGRPVYHLQAREGGPWRTVSAESGRVVEALAPHEAVEVATGFALRSGRLWGRGDGLLPRVFPVLYDQWTLSDSLHPYRPLYRVELGDTAGAEFYVSAVTGEVVRDTNRRERFWNYLGSVAHWVYVPVLRWNNALWRTLGRGVSAAATLALLTGFLLAARRRRWWRAGSGVASWHLRLGWVFGPLALAWVASGFLSFRIVALFDHGEPLPGHRERFGGGRLELVQYAGLPEDLGVGSSEVELVRVAGRSWVRCLEWNGAVRWMTRDGAGPWVSVVAGPGRDELLGQARQLLEGVEVRGWEILEGPDAYCAGGAAPGGGKGFPVLRVRYADRASTWFHVDLGRGVLLDRQTRGARVYRWAFDAVHCWDWPFLRGRGPWVDGLMLVFLAGGAAMTGAGLVLGMLRGRGRRGARRVGVREVAVRETDRGVDGLVTAMKENR